MEHYNWSRYVRIDNSWMNVYLQTHEEIVDNKLIIRCFTLKFSGNCQREEGLTKFISQQIIKFVYSEEDIQQIINKGDIPYQEALDYFGRVDPVLDGKYGELILFLFVESVFRAPLIAHKMKHIYPNDQQKGSDGLFFGQYNGSNALFLGESKFNKKVTEGIQKSLESLDRFHGNSTSSQALSHDLKIARDVLSTDLTEDDLNYLYDCLNPDNSEFQDNIMVHPVLVICDEKKIDLIERKAKNKTEAEEQMSLCIRKKVTGYYKSIQRRISKDFSELEKIHIDFFFVPMKDITKFRNSLYYAIHKVPYVEKSSGDEDENI